MGGEYGSSNGRGVVLAVDGMKRVSLEASIGEDGKATGLFLRAPDGRTRELMCAKDGVIELDDLLAAVAGVRDEREAALARRDPMEIRNMGYDLDEVEVELYESRWSMDDLIDSAAYFQKNGPARAQGSVEEAVKLAFRDLGLEPDRLMRDEEHDAPTGRSDDELDEEMPFWEDEEEDDPFDEGR